MADETPAKVLPLPVNTKGKACCFKCGYPEHLAARWATCAVTNCPIRWARTNGYALKADPDTKLDDVLGDE